MAEKKFILGLNEKIGNSIRVYHLPDNTYRIHISEVAPYWPEGMSMREVIAAEHREREQGTIAYRDAWEFNEIDCENFTQVVDELRKIKTNLFDIRLWYVNEEYRDTVSGHADLTDATGEHIDSWRESMG